MDLQQLRYVVEVADALSFTRAAERCFVTQSALSHQIAALEREVGQRLFIRSSRSVQLSEAGEAFVPHARQALHSVAHAVDDAAAVMGEVRGTLRLGVIPTVTAVDVPGQIRRFRRAHPSVRVEMRVGKSEALMADVRADELDIAILGLSEVSTPVGVASRVLIREQLVLAVPRSHRLADHAEIEMGMLAGEVFADFPAGTSGRAQSDQAFARAGIERDVAFEADAVQLLLDLVSAGVAVSLLPPGVGEGHGEGIVTVAVSDGPVRAQHLAWSQRSPRSVARAFLAQLDTE